jgi:hypothetical protein
MLLVPFCGQCPLCLFDVGFNFPQHIPGDVADSGAQGGDGGGAVKGEDAAKIFCIIVAFGGKTTPLCERVRHAG